MKFFSLFVAAIALACSCFAQEVQPVRDSVDTLSTVIVSGNRALQDNGTRIEARLLSRLPSAGGIEMMLKTIGASSSNELSSQYSARGGSFDENAVSINGIAIYRPQLAKSGQQEGMSIINGDMVQSLSFSTGGFDVRYEDKISSVLDITYFRPQSQKATAMASFNGASLYYGNCTKNDMFAHSTGARYYSPRLLLGTLEESGEYAPTFFDIQSFLSLKPSSKWKTEGIFYFANNSYLFHPVNRQTTVGGAENTFQLNVYFDGKEHDVRQTILASGTASYEPHETVDLKILASSYSSNENESYDILSQYWLNESQTSETGGEQSVKTETKAAGSFLRHARNRLQTDITSLAHTGSFEKRFIVFLWGAAVQKENYQYRIDEWVYVDSADYSAPYSEDKIVMDKSRYSVIAHKPFQSSGFALLRYNIPTNDAVIALSGGVKASWRNAPNALLVSPRFQASYLPNNIEKWRFKFYAGFYGQHAQLREMIAYNGSFFDETKPQTSISGSLRGEKQLKILRRPFKLTAEAYYKNLLSIIPYTQENVSIQYYPEQEATGYSTGIDLRLNGELIPGTESWASLSLMKSQEDILGNGHGYQNRPQDQLLNFALFCQDYLPKYKTFRMSLAFHYGTGLPIWKGGSDRKGEPVAELPSYRRVDVGFVKDIVPFNTTKKIKECWISLEVFNMFDTYNTISYYWIQDVKKQWYGVPNFLTSRMYNLKFFARI